VLATIRARVLSKGTFRAGVINVHSVLGFTLLLISAVSALELKKRKARASLGEVLLTLEQFAGDTFWGPLEGIFND
jgi:hypothetical protein